jgi:hypothetical protein
MSFVASVLFVGGFLGSSVKAVDNGLARTPPMGWVSDRKTSNANGKQKLNLVTHVAE